MRRETPKRVTSKEDPKRLKQIFTAQEIKEGKIDKFADQLKTLYKQDYPNIEGNIEVVYYRRQNDTVTIDNPLDGIASGKDAFILNTKKPQYYLRFGFLLAYIKNYILPRVKIGSEHNDNPPIFDIDDDTFSNHMFSLPNQISLDPRVCIVRNDSFYVGTSTPTQVYSNLYLFREKDNGTSANENAAYPMNIYLNFNFIIESLATDERGDVNTFEFLKSICDGLNKALGGINNLEPIIDETSNILRIVDTTPIPGYSTNPSQKYILQLYGYNTDIKTKIGGGTSFGIDISYTSNFVRKVDLKTAITPEFATMITVGATAGGYVKGVEATAFSKWNVGLTDRFKDEFEPGNIASIKPVGGVDEAESNYGEKIIIDGVVKRYGLTNFTPGSMEFSDDVIEGNISIGTEYFKYLIAKNKSSSGGTIGFIPFKISFTMDGLSGIKIYNKLNVDTRFLPKAYGDNLDLIVTGISHKLANNDWETDIEATVIPKSSAISTLGISSAFIEQSIEQGVAAAGGGVVGNTSGKRGDLFSWVKGPYAAPDPTWEANGYLVKILKGKSISGDSISVPTSPLEYKAGFPQTQTKKNGNPIKVSKYKSTDMSSTEQESMFKSILAGIGAPVTAGNLLWMKAWRQIEGGSALYNPWNSTQVKGTRSNYNKKGVQNYFTLTDGVQATISTLTNGYYPTIVAALKKGLQTQQECLNLAILTQKHTM